MKKNAAIVFFASLLVFTLLANASAPPETVNIHNRNAILLKNAQFDTTTTPQPPAIAASKLAVSQYSPGTEGYYIVQFNGPVHDEWKRAVRDTGAVIFDYIPNNAFIVRMDSSVKSQVQALPGVQWVGIYQPAYRISPALSAASTTSTAAVAAEADVGYEDVIVLLFDANDNGRAAAEISSLGGEIVDSSGDILRVRIAGSGISDIALINGVSWIEKYVQPVVFNDVAANITNAYAVRNTHGLTGSGQIVAVADTGLDTGVDDDSMHDDLEGRIVQIYDIYEDGADDVCSGHGTHVSGSVLGNGSNSSGQYAGMAPEARLVFQAIGNATDALILPAPFTDLFQQAYNDNAKIHSNSWGFTNSFGDYTSYSQGVDSFMWNNPDMLIIFAAGNDGDADNTTSPPATAKNCLSVGASENYRPAKGEYANNINEIANFSSRGPTDDGRVKPDVVAPGTWIISTRSSVSIPEKLWGDYDAYYRYSGGTSMSTPIVAGTAALVRQYYVQNESITPTAALIKATLINGAANLSLPTNDQGWGRVDIENSLFPASPRIMHYHDNITLNTSKSWNVSYYIYNSSEPLRVTLVWTDYPAAVSANVTLVNDLDLNVTGPGGSYLGNGGDSINNVEQVEYLTPPVGNYTIKVNGTNIPEGPQPFALVMSWGLDCMPPSATGEFPASSSYTTNNTTAVAVNITDTGIGVNLSSINMTINGTLVTFTNVSITDGYGIQNLTSTPYDEGIVTVSVNASDNASNLLTYSWSFIVDTVSPTSNTPADIEFSANATANFTNWKLFDLHPGHYWILRNGTQIISPTNWSNGIDVSVPVNTSISLGSFNYTIQYNDTAGNNGTQDTVIITINDTTAPYASGEIPTNDSFVYDNTPLISVNITDNASGVNESSIVMTVNGSIVATTNMQIAGGYTVSNQTVSPFTHTQIVNVTVNATDNNSNFMSYNWSFTVDGSAPVLTDPAADPPTIESNGTDTALLSVNVTDLSEISSVTINLSAINGSANAEMTNRSGTFTITTNATGVGNNTFNLPLNATDNAGNSNTSVNITLNTTDTTPPVLSGRSPANATGTTSLAPTISINATDRGSLINASSALMTVNGTQVVLANTTSGFTYNFSNTTTVAYTHGDTVNVTFNVSDNEGHTSDTSSWMFYIDNVTPTISITSPSGGYSTTASSITVSGMVNGTGSPPLVTVNDADATLTLTDFNGTFTATASLSVGTNTIYANVTDASENANSTSITVTRTTPTTPSNGGGGGGGGTTGESYTNIEFKDVSRVYINKDSHISFTFDEPENDIRHIQYKALTSAGYVSTIIEVLKDTSAFAKQPAPGMVYKNINIWVGKAGYATANNIEDPVIGFKVAKKWIQDNRINVRSIKLNRYHDDVWTALPTTKTDEDTAYVYFESRTPGFSPFAITSEKRIPASVVSVKNEATAAPTDEPTGEPTGTTAVAATEADVDAEQPSGRGPLLLGVVALVTIAGAYIYMRKRQS